MLNLSQSVWEHFVTLIQAGVQLITHNPGHTYLYALTDSFYCMYRYGFPPRELLPPGEGQEEEPVPLQHGDRVMVEHLKQSVPEEHPDVVMSELKAQEGGSSAPLESSDPAKAEKQRQGLYKMNRVCSYRC